jgi:hypothetical protein
MRRRLFTVLSALSLLLFAAVCVLWVRSYQLVDQYVSNRKTGTVVGVQNIRGQVLLISHTYGPGSPMPGAFHDGYARLPAKPALPVDGGRSLPGFAYTERDEGSLQMKSRILAVPHWALLIALALVPVLRVTVLSERRRRQRLGLCPGCGYDLRATPGRRLE